MSEQLSSMTISQLDALNLDELREDPRSMEISGYTRTENMIWSFAYCGRMPNARALSLAVASWKLSKMALAFFAATTFCPALKMSMSAKAKFVVLGFAQATLSLVKCARPKKPKNIMVCSKLRPSMGLTPKRLNAAPSLKNLRRFFPMSN